ncbi:hypothetical protein IHN63_00085 [Deinococcus sp. 6YEL10]|uniref:hypothetical protein n=1 Tax=Deinococcus sp. 6YEL10 TaxID=2745870 RepID=UPI001E5A839C|nr:hypothetical protein [Deinococcus sp. 6YEL10]MCD0159696.1 hypothetical protein [Deinococcus sp. 6YEL10]
MRLSSEEFYSKWARISDIPAGVVAALDTVPVLSALGAEMKRVLGDEALADVLGQLKDPGSSEDRPVAALYYLLVRALKRTPLFCTMSVESVELLADTVVALMPGVAAPEGVRG